MTPSVNFMRQLNVNKDGKAPSSPQKAKTLSPGRINTKICYTKAESERTNRFLSHRPSYLLWPPLPRRSPYVYNRCLKYFKHSCCFKNSSIKTTYLGVRPHTSKLLKLSETGKTTSPVYP